MPSSGFRLGLPPPSLVVETSVEDVVTATKITVTRSGTVTRIGGWVSGNPAGVNPDQPGIFHLYADDGSGLNPGLLLTYTQEINLTGLLPGVQCISAPLAGPSVHVDPGVYWVGANIGNAGGTGEWILYGEAVVGGIRKRNANTYPTRPPTFPLAGAVTTNGQSAGVGFVFTQDPQEITGSIVGTFLVGTKLVGGIQGKFNTSSLILKGRKTTAVVTADYHNVKVSKPQLILKGKTTTAFITIVVTANPGRLILRGKTAEAKLIPFARVTAAPDLNLLGKATGLRISQTVPFSKPTLYLLGRLTVGKIPGLVVPTPVQVILVPTVCQPLTLEGTVCEEIELVPTKVVIS